MKALAYTHNPTKLLDKLGEGLLLLGNEKSAAVSLVFPVDDDFHLQLRINLRHGTWETSDLKRLMDIIEQTKF